MGTLRIDFAVNIFLAGFLFEFLAMRFPGLKEIAILLNSGIFSAVLGGVGFFVGFHFRKIGNIERTFSFF